MQIDAAIVAWRARRDPKLGAMIVSLGKPDPAITGPLAKLKPTHLVKALLDEFAAPERAAARMGSLVPQIERAVREARGAWPVVALLADAPADPRVGRIAILLLDEHDQLPHKTTKLWRQLLAAVDKHGDPSCVEILRTRVLPKVEGMSARRVGGVANRLAKAKPLSKGELASLEGHTVATDQGAALLAAVYADPTSDAAREIYADHLIAAGDPRGEFIQLQLQRAAGTATDKRMKRELALLRKHYKDWLGPLRHALFGVSPDDEDPPTGSPALEPCEVRVPEEKMGVTTFARGFVYRIHALFPAKRHPKIVDDPMLATIRIAARIPALTPAMRGLASIERGTNAMLADRAWSYFFCDETPPVELLRTCQVHTLAMVNPMKKEIDAVRANRHLRTLEVHPWPTIPWNLRTVDWDTIETLVIYTNAARFRIDLAKNHVDIEPIVIERDAYRAAMKGFGKPFASAHVIATGTGAKAEVALAVAKQLAIAKKLY